MATDIIVNTNYCFFNYAYNKVIDDYQHQTGGKAILYRAHLGKGSPEGYGNQLWTTTDNNGDGYFTLACLESESDPSKPVYVLGVDGNNNVFEVPKDTTKDAQRWKFTKDSSDSTLTPSWFICSKLDNNMVITAPNGSNETQLQISKNQGALPSQRWIAFPISVA